MSADNEDSGVATAVIANDDLKFVMSVTHGYLGTLKSRFTPGLHFSDLALARAACVCGWITGLAQCGQTDLANRMAACFIANLRRLSTYGGQLDYTYKGFGGEGHVVKIPAYTVELHDDGSTHSFAIHWYRPLYTPEMLTAWVGQPKPRDTRVFDCCYEVPHAFSFHGGLIYYGPGGGETFTVSLTNEHFWSVHT